jgi:hypothetical protein
MSHEYKVKKAEYASRCSVLGSAWDGKAPEALPRFRVQAEPGHEKFSVFISHSLRS